MKKLLFVLMVLLALCGMAYSATVDVEVGETKQITTNVSFTPVTVKFAKVEFKRISCAFADISDVSLSLVGTSNVVTLTCKVTGRLAGSGSINLTINGTKSGSSGGTASYSQSIPIKVTEPVPDVQAVVVDPSYVKLEVGESFTPSVSVIPSGAPQGVTFTQTPESTEYFTVGSYGKVTALKSTYGVKYPVVVASTANPTVKTTFYVEVYEIPKYIEITDEEGIVPIKVKNTKNIQLIATVYPLDFDQRVTWSSSDDNILSVDENGLVKAVHNGIAKIRATSVKDPSVFGEIELKSFISIKEVNLFYKGTDVKVPNSIILPPGNSASFEVRFNPTDATEKTMSWRNQNDNIVKITENDDLYNNVTITALTGGKTQFTYVSKNGKGAGLTVYVPWFKVNKPSINVKVGDDPVKSNVVLYPDALRETETVEYVIENPEIISIDENGYITGLKKGTTTFYAKACGVESEVVTVNVESDYVPVEGISFTDRKLFLHPNDQYTFTVIFNPSNASDQRLTWKVSNKSVLSIENGKIVALANGYSKVEARSVDGKKVALCDVYVTDKVSDFRLSKASVILGVDETAKITASFKPKELSGTLEWFVGDDTVASIDTNSTVCNITGVGLGNTKVYARVDGITLECVVTVEEPEVTE